MERWIEIGVGKEKKKLRNKEYILWADFQGASQTLGKGTD
jgi:hypothetical protein